MLKKFLDHHPTEPGVADIRQVIRDVRDAGFAFASLTFVDADPAFHPDWDGWEGIIECAPGSNARISVFHTEIAEVIGTMRRIAAEPELASALEAVGRQAKSVFVDVAPVPTCDALVGDIQVELGEPAGFTLARSEEIVSVGMLVEWARAELAALG